MIVPLPRWVSAVALLVLAPPAWAGAQTPAGSSARPARAHAIDLEAAQPAEAEIEALRALAGDARILIVGSAFPGTRESWRARTRIAQIALEHLGFAGVATDAGWFDSRAIDAWIGSGAGSLEEALARLASVPWRTAEAREFVGRLRALGEVSPGSRARLAGLDPLPVQGATIVVQDFLNESSPEDGPRLGGMISPFRQTDPRGLPRYASMDLERRHAFMLGTADLLEVVTMAGEEWNEGERLARWRYAMRCMEAVADAELLLRTLSEGQPSPLPSLRASTLRAEMAALPGEARVVVLTDLAAARFDGSQGQSTLASLLVGVRDRRVVSIGVLAGSGSVLVSGRSADGWPSNEGHVVEIGAPAETSVEAALARAQGGAALWILDELAGDPERSWHLTELEVRAVGDALPEGEAPPTSKVTLATAFDAVLFVERVRAAK